MFEDVYSNPAEFDDQGQLVINPYHFNAFCNLSSPNLCKGQVLEEHRKKQETKHGRRFAFAGFAGDGVNDFCPMLRLGVGDLALPRHDFAIGPFIERMSTYEDLHLRADRIFWSSGDQIVSAVESKLEEMGLS